MKIANKQSNKMRKWKTLNIQPSGSNSLSVHPSSSTIHLHSAYGQVINKMVTVWSRFWRSSLHQISTFWLPSAVVDLCQVRANSGEPTPKIQTGPHLRRQSTLDRPPDMYMTRMTMTMMMLMATMITSVLRMVQPSGRNGLILSSNIRPGLPSPRSTGKWGSPTMNMTSENFSSVNLEMMIGKLTFVEFSIKDPQNKWMKVKVINTATRNAMSSLQLYKSECLYFEIKCVIVWVCKGRRKKNTGILQSPWQ